MFRNSRSFSGLLSLICTIILASQAWATTVNELKIVFVSQRDGNNEIYVMNRDGSGQTRLTNSPAHEIFPSAAPDGRTIAFVRQTLGGYSIFLMNHDGENVRSIPGLLVSPERISWSPDGTRLAFVRNNKIHSVGIDGTGEVQLSTSQVIDSHPSWSPDGSWIAFTRWSGLAGPNGIFRMRADGSDARVILSHYFIYARLEDPFWSPDGARVIFTYPNQGDLAANDSIGYVENGSTVPLIAAQAGAPLRSGPRYSPDGQSFVFYQTLPESDFSGPFQIASFDQALTDRSSSNFSPDWLPARVITSVSGRVMGPNGVGLRNTSVVLTDEAGVRRTATTSSFGLYSFDDLPLGRVYTVSVASKRFRFQSRTLTVFESATGFDLIGLE